MGEGRNKWSSSWGLVLLLLILVSVLLVGTLINIREEGGIVTAVSVHPARWCTSPLGVVPAGLGEGVGDCHDAANLPRVRLSISLAYLFEGFFFFFSLPLDMLVAKCVPTPCYNDAYSVGTPKCALWEKGWLKHCFTLFWTFLFGKQKGPGPRVFTPGELSIEFANIGGWLTFGDLALNSCA